MNEEHTKHLHESYPRLYVRKTYFECQDGWFDLINELSIFLENEMCKEETPYCYAVQVKEKFGQLRLYMSASTEYMDHLIADYCIKSGVTCEICAAPGTRVSCKGWIKTLCTACHNKNL